MTSTSEEAPRGRRVAALDRNRRWSLTEDFRFKRPWGARVGEVEVKGLKTWTKVFAWLLAELHKRAPERFATLPEAPFAQARLRALISRDSEGMTNAIQIGGLTFEANDSANNLTARLLQVQSHCDVKAELNVYLREDRNAG